MNKFNIPEPSGGFKLKAHDLNLIYSYLAEGIGGLASEHNAILSGAQLGGDLVNANISEGFVSIQGEVYKVNAQSWLTINIGDPCFVPVETVVPPSPRTSADASILDVHFQRIARIEQHGAQPVKVRINDIANYADPFRTIFNPSSGAALRDHEYTNAWRRPSSQLISQGYEPLKVRKTGKYLELKGNCEIDSFALNQIAQLSSLLAGYNGAIVRPAFKKVIMVPCSAIGSAPPPLPVLPEHFVMVVIDEAGAVFASESAQTLGVNVLLHFEHKVALS
jgi:hypothetical protein